MLHTPITAALPSTYDGWVQFFLPEGEAHVAARREMGDYISSPYDAVLGYAGSAAFYALMKGPAFQKLDMDRAREMAAYMCGRAA